MALLCNVGAADPGGLGGEVADLLLDDLGQTPPAPPPAPRPRPTVEVVRADLVARAGLYREATTGEPLDLVLRDDRLWANGSVPLHPRSATAFDLGESDTVFHFDLAPDGRRPRIRATAEPVDGSVDVGAYEPVDPFGPSALELEAFVGAYYSADAEAMLTVTIQDDRLVILRRSGDRIPLTPLYADAFRGPGGLVRFQRDAAGRVTGLQLREPRVHAMEFSRVDGRDGGRTSSERQQP